MRTDITNEKNSFETLMVLNQKNLKRLLKKLISSSMSCKTICEKITTTWSAWLGTVFVIHL